MIIKSTKRSGQARFFKNGKLNAAEITEDQFYEMFECLPPMQYRKDNKGMSFKMSEMTFGDITQGYVKKNGKYYSMNCRLHTKHEEMCGVCI